MANEYNELEQLVNDVTNIDTARMTLRWALERLNSIEKERAELKKTLAITEDTRKALEAKVQSLDESFKSRGKVLEEKEGFYSKLEATMALLGDGKLDIQQLLKKEARLDQLGLELEREYQDKFAVLDKNQNSVIERWNQRLLDVESQYAKRLSESQVRYDSLRQELESDHQSRLGTLNVSYQLKEKELAERIKTLETSLKSNGNALEGRRKDIEAEFLAKKSEIESNYLKLKSVLETGFQERIHSMENDNCAQVRALEKTWNAERERLMAEQHARDEQFEKSQKEMARLEAQLSEQQERHHGELIELISKKEEAFRGKVEALEKDKAAYEQAVRTLTVRLENKEQDWIAQKGQLQADFARRVADLESSAAARALAFEKDGAVRTEAMEKLIAASKEESAREAAVRVEEARRDMEEEKARLTEDNQIKALALGRAAEMIRDLEVTLASSSEDHHRELIAKIRANEENFRAKLAEFETEKEEYKSAIAGLTEAAGMSDVRYIEETKRIQKEFSEKYAELEAKAAAGAANSRTAYEARLSALMTSFEAKEKVWVLEREKLGNELAAISGGAQALASERVEKIKAVFEARKAELERQFDERLAGATSALAFEKAQMVSDLKTASEQYTRLTEQFKELENTIAEDRRAHHEELMGKLSEKETALKAQAEQFGKELAFKEELAAQAAAETAAMETAWLKEKKNLSVDFAARFQLQEDGLSKREEALENQYRLKAAELEKNAAEVRGLMEADFQRRVEVEKQAFDDAKARLSDESRLKGEQLAEARALATERVEKIRAVYEVRKADFEKQMEERLAAAASALAFEKAHLVADLKTASAEYTKLAEQTKELEATITNDRQLHHEALMRHMSEKEAALKSQTDNFNKETLKLREEAGAREAAWQAEREKLRAEALEAEARAGREASERSALMAQDYDHKKAELERILNERLAEKEAVLRLETANILEESRLKDERLAATHARVKELESKLSAQGGAHHEELAARLEEKEAVLKAQAVNFEREVRDLTAAFNAKESAWNKEKAELGTGFAARLLSAEKEMAAKETILHEQYRLKEAEFNRNAAEARKLAESELARLLAGEQDRFEKAKMRLEEESDIKEKQLVSTHGKVKELEKQIGELKNLHHSELMAAQDEKEAVMRTQAASFNSELGALRDAYNAKMSFLAREKDAALKAQAEAFNKELGSLREGFGAKEAFWSREKEKANAALADNAARSEREQQAHAAQLSAEYEHKKAELERILNERLAEKEAVLRLETENILEASQLKDAQLAATHSRVKELENKLNAVSGAHHQELMARLAEKEQALKAQADTFSKEKAAALETQSRAFRAEAEALTNNFSARKSAWQAEREKSEAAHAELSAAAERETKAREARLAGDYENKKAQLEKQFREKYDSAAEALAFEKARLVADLRTASSEYTKLAEHVKELEGTIAADRQEHHAELMAKLADKEAALKAQADEFNGELAGQRDGFEEEKARLASEARLKGEQLSSAYAKLGDMERRAGELRDSYREELAARLKEKEDAFSAKIAALEADYAVRREALANGLAAKEGALNKEASARIGFERTTWQAQEARLETMISNAAEDFRKAQKEIERLSASVAAKEEESVRLKAELAEQAELAAVSLRSAANETVARKSAGLEAAYKDRKERLEAEADAQKKALQEDHDERVAELAANYEAGARRAALENEALRSSAEKTREELAAVQLKADAYINGMMEKEHAHQTEMLKLKEDLATELNVRVAEAAEKAAQMQQGRMRFLEKELSRLQQNNADALKAAEEAFRTEKERLTEELGLRKAHIGAADRKLQEMEAELMKSRQNAAAIYLGQITEQDDRFKAMIKEYEDRQDKLEKAAAARQDGIRQEYEGRLRDMEEMLKSKDSLVRQGGDFWRQKQAELDTQHSALNMKINSFNEEIFAQRQTLSERENALNAQQLEREKDLAARMSEIQKLKVELTRTIAEYKSRK